MFGFAQAPQLMTPFIGDTRAFHRLQSAAAGLDYAAAEPNFTLALATLTTRLKRRSLVVVFSDFTDPTAAEIMVESLGRLANKHLVLFVTMADAEIEAVIRRPARRHRHPLCPRGHRRYPRPAAQSWCCNDCAGWEST